MGMVTHLTGSGLRAAKLALCGGAMMLAATATPAHAFGHVAAVPAAYTILTPVLCPGGSTPALSGPVASAPVAPSRASVILGNRVSALDRIRQQQEGSREPTQSAIDVPLPRASTCQVAAQPETANIITPAIVTPEPASFRGDSFLNSSRVPIGFTPASADWNRVARAELSASTAQAIFESSGADDLQLIQQVNQWVNNTIAHVDDRVLYGQSDYWAAAEETLSLRQGDCEDFAILKYQMLAAMGVRREDMFLTLAYDTVRGADHAMLIVRLDDGFYMLDNATNQILPADQSYDYRPQISYSGARSWLHTSNVGGGATRPVHLSVNATSNPREIGLNR